METISPQQAFEKQKGETPIIDVRTGSEFRGGHAQGVQHLPLDTLAQAGDTITSLASKTGEILVICQSGVRAKKAAEQIERDFSVTAHVIEGGTNAWEKASLPMEKEAGAVMSLERQVRIAAGGLVAMGSLLTWLVDPNFVFLPLFVGSGLVFAGVTDTCGMGMLIAKMPWNR